MITQNALGIRDMSRHKWEMSIIVADLIRIVAIWATHTANNGKYCHRLFRIFLFVQYLYRYVCTRWKDGGPN